MSTINNYNERFGRLPEDVRNLITIAAGETEKYEYMDLAEKGENHLFAKVAKVVEFHLTYNQNVEKARSIALSIPDRFYRSVSPFTTVEYDNILRKVCVIANGFRQSGDADLGNSWVQMIPKESWAIPALVAWGITFAESSQFPQAEQVARQLIQCAPSEWRTPGDLHLAFVKNIAKDLKCPHVALEWLMSEERLISYSALAIVFQEFLELPFINADAHVENYLKAEQILRSMQGIAHESQFIRLKPMLIIGWQWLIRHLIENNQYPKAKEAVQKIQDPWCKTSAMLEIIYQFFKQNDVDKAVEYIKTLEGGDSRQEVIKGFAAQLVNSSFFNGPTSVAQMFEEDDLKNQVMRYIVEELSKKKDFEGAVTAANSIQNVDLKDNALKYIAEVLSKEEEFVFAVTVASSIQNVELKDQAQEYIVKALAESNIFDRALEVVELIVNVDLKDRALQYIANVLSRRNVFDRAEQVAQKITNPYVKDRSLGSLVLDLAQNKNPDALRVAQLISAGPARKLALDQIYEKSWSYWVRLKVMYQKLNASQ